MTFGLSVKGPNGESWMEPASQANFLLQKHVPSGAQYVDYSPFSQRCEFHNPIDSQYIAINGNPSGGLLSYSINGRVAPSLMADGSSLTTAFASILPGPYVNGTVASSQYTSYLTGTRTSADNIGMMFTGADGGFQIDGQGSAMYLQPDRYDWSKTISTATIGSCSHSTGPLAPWGSALSASVSALGTYIDFATAYKDPPLIFLTEIVGNVSFGGFARDYLGRYVGFYAHTENLYEGTQLGASGYTVYGYTGASATTMKYFVLATEIFPSPSDSVGLQVFNGTGGVVYDSRGYNPPLQRHVFPINRPYYSQGNGATTGAASLAACPAYTGFCLNGLPQITSIALVNVFWLVMYAGAYPSDSSPVSATWALAQQTVVGQFMSISEGNLRISAQAIGGWFMGYDGGAQGQGLTIGGAGAVLPQRLAQADTIVDLFPAYAGRMNILSCTLAADQWKA